ncbi:hypothetical protein ANN_25173 [Periplaneta americana]|uniref:Transposase Tc1-like domain-containing protein n=1 Tax=Periplaneta americana TaxID=6978 RepID=A0ABQ8S0W1_PERAM|nr:hypothetical protein ANN_25173 [Periplaneta americana]
MSPGSNTESYPAFAHIGLRENPGKNLNQVVVITEELQNVHLLLEYRPHIDVSLTCEYDPKLKEYCVCPQNMPQFDSEGIPNQAPETNKPMILNGPTSRNREGSDQRCASITYMSEKLHSKYGVHSEEYLLICTNIPRRSRESFLNEREKRFIVNKVKVNPRVTAPEIVQMLQQASGKKVSSQTVRRVLWQRGYRGRIPRKRPCVSKKNRAARLAFAKEHQDKPQTFWNTVICSDETKINLFGSDGIQTVWRKANTADNVENTLPTVKHGGGSIKLRGCMSSKGVGTIHFIDDNLNKWGYLNILKNNVKQSVEKMGLLASYMFQQDNDPKHTAEINKLWLIWNVPKQLRTPAQSADLNPIEHLWPILKRRVRKCKVTSKEDLKRNLGENHDSGMQEGHKMPETTEDDRSDISRKVERIADFLQNKLEKLIEEKIKESLGNATTRRELRSTAEESRDQQEEGNKPDSPTIEKREGKNGEPRHWDGQEDEVEGTWTRVTYGRSNRTNRTQGAKQTIGTNTRMDEDIQAAQRYAWLFLGRLKEDTTADKVKNTCTKMEYKETQSAKK